MIDDECREGSEWACPGRDAALAEGQLVRYGIKLENIILKTEGQMFLKGIANKIIDGSCLINSLTSLCFHWYDLEASSTQSSRTPLQESAPVSTVSNLLIKIPLIACCLPVSLLNSPPWGHLRTNYSQSHS